MPRAAATPSKAVRYRPEKPKKKRRRKITPKSPEKVISVEHGNTKGLPTLPVELHLEIISYLTSVPIPCPTSGILPAKYRDKFDTLFALSQTCSALYHIYHPLAWRSLEVCATRREARMTRVLSRQMATELVAQIEVVTIRAPHLAEFVQVFNVVLTAFSSPKVYKEFVRCLHCLPNLHTLQIIGYPDRKDQEPEEALRSLENAFMQGPLPSIKTLTVPVELLIPMRVRIRFPNLRHLAILGWYHVTNTSTTDVLRWIPPSIYSLHGYPKWFYLLHPSTQNYDYLIEQFPHLRVTPQLSFEHTTEFTESRDVYVKRIRTYLLSWTHKFPELHTFRLQHHEGSRHLVSVDAVVEIAKDVLVRHLKAHEDIAEGWITVCHWDSPYRVVKVRRPSPSAD